MAEPPHSNTTILAQGALLEGSIKTEGALRIEGAVLGEVRSTGSVSVSTTGRVLGEVRAEVLHIAGRLDGIAIVRDALEVDGAGCVQGYVRYRALRVARGGVMNCSSSQRDQCSEEELDDAAQ